MKATKIWMASLLFLTAGFVGGCHYGSYDDHRGYGDYGYGYSSSYRDGFRDGRAYERRNNDSRYSSDSWRRRW